MEPLIRKFPNITPQAIPNVFSPLKKTKLRELMHKLDALREENSPKESKRGGEFYLDNFNNSHQFNNFISFLNIKPDYTPLFK